MRKTCLCFDKRYKCVSLQVHFSALTLNKQLCYLYVCLPEVKYTKIKIVKTCLYGFEEFEVDNGNKFTFGHKPVIFVLKIYI